MRATLWHGTDELGALRCAVLREIFAACSISLDVVRTQAELEAAAAQSRRVGDAHILLFDCASGRPLDVDRCIAAGAATTFPIYLLCPDRETFGAIERAVGRPLVWLQFDFSLEKLVNKLHVLKLATASDAIASKLPRSTLTPREHEVQGLREEGCTTAQIAARLGLSEETVHTHLGNIRRKQTLPTAIVRVREGHESSRSLG